MWSFPFKNRIALVIAMVLTVSLLSSCRLGGGDTEEPVTKTEFAMDTICSITLYGTDDELIFKECFQKISDIEKKMSVDLDESEVSEINRNAGVKAVTVSDDTYRVIRAGVEFGELTSGNFDISVGPLVKLWGISKANPKIPSAADVKSAVSLVNFKNIELEDKEKSVFLKEKGMSIDLGGIAKGYAGDAVAEIIRAKGVRHAIVDLGGNLIVIGGKPDGTDWNVGIQTPFSPNGDYLAVLSTSDKAVVTSGIYQRYFEENGKIYHHIMDTKTGYPVDNGLVSVTVVSGSSMNSDALAKAFTLGLEKGMAFIESQKGAEAIFVTDKKEVYVTSGLSGKLKITDDDYQLKVAPDGEEK